MLSINTLMAFYFYKRFIPLSLPIFKNKIILWAYRLLALFLGASSILYMLLREQTFSRFFILLFIFSFALLIMLFLSSLLNDLTWLLIYLWQKIKRETFSSSLKTKISTILYTFNFLFIALGFYGGIKTPSIKEVTIPISNFPFEKFESLKIALISDLHIGDFAQKDFCQSVVEAINGQNPDLVIIAGDLFDRPPYKIKDYVAPLANLKSRYGSYFVLGNHEYYVGADSVKKLISTLNIKGLYDETVQIGLPKPLFNLMGVTNSAWQHAGKISVNFRSANRGRILELPTIMVSHRPNVAVTEQDRIDLILSGHTHGGQIFPFHFFVARANQFLAGHYKISSSTQLYLSRGTGLWGPPIRLFAPSEITLLTITAE